MTEHDLGPLSITGSIKRHCVVEVFVNPPLECYLSHLGDGEHAVLGINNLEMLGSLDRLEEVVAELADLIRRLRADPETFDRWRNDGRQRHPLLTSLPAHRDDEGNGT